ncbi:hypothetical protein TA5114_00014 [Cognatishimia activa]|uniref:Uncharacterized protein n=1 Tax=Cognatishimia activa TaxID=1715691 RepID=A0A0P1IKZ6_9RHOB|nr:hypothetical protein TA5114_00014 [Cognatishimia activa]
MLGNADFVKAISGDIGSIKIPLLNLISDDTSTTFFHNRHGKFSLDQVLNFDPLNLSRRAFWKVIQNMHLIR